MREIVGASPVHPVLLATGKLGFALSWVILPLRVAGVDLLGVTVPIMKWPAVALAVIGIAVIAGALVRLGDAARVGLPGTETTLKTTGLYSLTRNPIYVAATLVSVGSCLYVPHWLNIASTIVAAAIHHRIVLAEEQFLVQRFGPAWEDYTKRVRRY